MRHPEAAASSPERADEQELLTGEAVSLQLRPTSIVLRAASVVIDYTVYGTVAGIVAQLMLASAPALGIPENLTIALLITTVAIGLIVAPAVVETATQGRSLGRWALGSRIVRDDGGSIAFRHALIRSFVGLFELIITFGGVAVVVAMLNAKAQRLGDLLAGTYSQYERVPTVVPQTFGVPEPLQNWAKTADVARLPDPLARRIAQFLAQAGAHTPTTRDRLAATLVDDARAFVAPVPDADPELLLAAIAVLRRERQARALAGEKAHLERLAPTLQALPHGFPDRG
jgi:uncharacterized RDD family membrane protein YckC